VRTIDEILADMQAIMAKPDGEMTADDLLAYQALELELAQVQESVQPDEATEGEPEPEPAPAPATAQAPHRAAALAAARTRHAAYNRVVVPAGRPSNRQRENAEGDGFRAYLRTAQPNADITGLRINGPEDIGSRGPRNAQGETSGPAGGYLVPEGFRAKIIERMKRIGGLSEVVETITTETGNNLPWPTIDDTANSGEVVDEAADNTTGADVTFGIGSLGAWEYQAGGTGGSPLKLPWALMNDNAVDVEGLVARLLGKRLQRALAPHLISGTGVKQPKGIVAGITGTAGSLATGPSYDDLVSLITAVDIDYWEGARFAFNQSTLGKVWKLKDSNNNPIWRSFDFNQSTPLEKGSLLGYPVTIDNSFSDYVGTGGTGTNWGVFGNLEAAYVLRKVLDIALVVNPWSSASKRMNEYTAWMRADGAPQDANAYSVGAGKA
jgi:HK97 family phage major capsid protein